MSTSQEGGGDAAPEGTDPPKPERRAEFVTTQTSVISPLASPEAEAAAAARIAAKKRLGQTAIGIAPPAIGSKAPPVAPVVDPVANTEPFPATRAQVSAEDRPRSRPAPALPSAASKPPPAPSTGKLPPSPPSTPQVGETRPSKPPTVPPAPSTMPGMTDAFTSTAPRAPARGDEIGGAVVTTGSAPPSPFTDTLVAAKAPDLRDLTATQKSSPATFSSPPVPVAPEKLAGTTLIGTAPAMDPPAGGTSPSVQPIVPRRRTPAAGMGAVKAPFGARLTPMGGMPKITPNPATPPDSRVSLPDSVPAPVLTEKVDLGAPRAPIIRIPHGGMLGHTTLTQGGMEGSLICEILVKNRAVTQEAVDRALAQQEERGGQIGRLLVQAGACTEEAIARALVEQLRMRKDEGHLSDISAAAREKKDVAGLKVLTRPTRTVFTLLLTDLFSLCLAALVATMVHWLRTYSELQEIDWSAWLVVGPGIALCMLTFLGLELYSPMAKSTPDEIRDITFSASLVHLGASLLSTLGDLPIVKWGIFVRGVWWAVTLFLVPVMRSLVRGALSVQPWWGIPVCVLGAAKTGRLIVRTLKAQPRSGLKPVMLLDDDIAKHGTLRASFTNEVMDVYSVNVSASHFLTDAQRAELASDIFGSAEEEPEQRQPISSDYIPAAPDVREGAAPSSLPPSNKRHEPIVERPSAEFFSPESHRLSTRAPTTKDASLFPRGKFAEVDGVPLVGDLSLAPILADRLNIPYAVLAMPGLGSQKLLQIVERIGGKFTHLLIIPDLFGFATMGVPAKSLGGILGVEVRQQLLLPGPRLAKRIMDTALTLTGVLFILPFLLIIAALVKLDSKGPLFYTQKRLGKDGTYFDAYKFRTMHGDGEARLKAILDADPALKAEYDIYHKLKKDPRVTRVGRILRKFSLDEFPQLLNVIKGDMSLVGPRPYIEREVNEMGGQEKIILRAPPGMTGMWQVSDRAAMPFAQRVQIDVYYVRNWSPWLDIHILAKTFGVVVRGTGS